MGYKGNWEHPDRGFSIKKMTVKSLARKEFALSETEKNPVMLLPIMWHDRDVVPKPNSWRPCTIRGSSLCRQLQVLRVSKAGSRSPTSGSSMGTRWAVLVQAHNTFRSNDSSSMCPAWRALAEKRLNSWTVALCKAKGRIWYWLLAWHVLLFSTIMSIC